MKAKIKYYLATALLAVCNTPALLAQKMTADTFLSNTESQLSTLGSKILNVVSIVVGLAAAVSLILVYIESQKPQSQSKDNMVKWFSVLVIILVALQLLKLLI